MSTKSKALVLGMVLAFCFLLRASLDAQVVTTLLQGDPEASVGPPAALNPFGVWVSDDGVTYVADTSTQRILRIDPDGRTSTVAGTGRFGRSGDGGPAVEAQFANPTDVAVDVAGSIYVADTHNHTIRKVTPGGTVIRYAGTGSRGKGAPFGQARNVDLDTPAGLFVDASRNLYIADTGNDRVLRVGLDGTLTLVAGSDRRGPYGEGVPATAASLSGPTDVWVDAAGQVYIVDRSNHRVRRVDSDDNVWTVAGTGEAGYSGDGRTATNANLRYPWSVSVDHEGTVYISDTGNRAVRRVDPSGTISTIPLPRADRVSMMKPYGIYISPSRSLTIADTEVHTVLRLESPESVLRISHAPTGIPADGTTSREIGILGIDGSTVAARFSEGRGVLELRGSGVGVAGTSPGEAVVELWAPGAWPVAVSVAFTPIRSLSGRWDRSTVIANGDDEGSLALDVDRALAEGETYGVTLLYPDGREETRSVSNVEEGLRFRTGTPGVHTVEVQAPGAFPLITRIEATPPRPWEQRDAYEPNDVPERAPVVTETIAATLHTGSDVDWYQVPVRSGYQTELVVVSEHGRVRFDGSGEDALILAPDGTEPSGMRSVALRGIGQTADYELRITQTRLASFAIEGAGAIRANGQPHSISVQLLDHLGQLDTGDDSTRIHVSLVSGDATLSDTVGVVSDGRLPIALSIHHPGELVLAISGPDIPSRLLSVIGKSGAGVDADPASGNQSSTILDRVQDEIFTIDVHVDTPTGDLRGAHYRVAYDPDAVQLLAVQASTAFREAETIVTEEQSVVEVSTALLGSETQLADGWIGRLTFQASTVSSTVLVLERVSVGYADGSIEPMLVGSDREIQVEIRAPVSFTRFAEIFGSREGDVRYDSRYDIDADGTISYLDFLAWAAQM